MIRVAWLILRKDLTVEVRSKEIVYTTLFFAVSCVLVFAFALVREGRGPEDGAAGILWIAVMFAGEIVALGTPEEIRKNPHPRVQQFLNRVPEEPERDGEAYLQSLTGGAGF